jgi:hypothetical protein
VAPLIWRERFQVAVMEADPTANVRKTWDAATAIAGRSTLSPEEAAGTYLAERTTGSPRD